MNLLLMPLWLLSGAFFPLPRIDAATSWPVWLMGWLMRVNPVTYMMAGVRRTMFGPVLGDRLNLPPAWICWTVTAVFAAAMVGLGCWITGTRTKGDLI